METAINKWGLSRQHKFLLILPLLLLPFLTFGFWVLGGGKGKKNAQAYSKSGFNTNLPSAKLKNENDWNKLNFYMQAEKDSLKLKDQMNNDPFYSFKEKDTTDTLAERGKPAFDGKVSYDPYPSKDDKDIQEEKVYQRINQLNQLIQKQDTPANVSADHKRSTSGPVQSPDVERLEMLMEQMNGKQSGMADPEMQQIDGMLNKILDIQNPGRVSDRLLKESEKNRKNVYTVKKSKAEFTPTLLSGTQRRKTDSSVVKDTSFPVFIQHNTFYGIGESGEEYNTQPAIEAVIPESQTVVSGNSVKLRLSSEVLIAGVRLPKDSYIVGVTTLAGDRLNITINSVRYQNYILPVNLAVYDLDGLQGIAIPNLISREVSKQSADQAIQGIGLSSLDPNLGAQAASAGIEAAKQLLSKKVKLVKVTIKNGYRVLLKDNNQDRF